MRSLLGVCSIAAIGAVASVLVQLPGCEHNTVRQEFYANGRVASEQGFDAQGRRHGAMRHWDASGVLRVQFEYVHGEIVRAVAFDDHGKLQTERREGNDYLMRTVR